MILYSNENDRKVLTLTSCSILFSVTICLLVIIGSPLRFKKI